MEREGDRKYTLRADKPLIDHRWKEDHKEKCAASLYGSIKVKAAKQNTSNGNLSPWTGCLCYQWQSTPNKKRIQLCKTGLAPQRHLSRSCFTPLRDDQMFILHLLWAEAISECYRCCWMAHDTPAELLCELLKFLLSPAQLRLQVLPSGIELHLHHL